MATTIGFGLGEEYSDSNGFDLPENVAAPFSAPYPVAAEETAEDMVDYWGKAFDDDEINEATRVDLPPEGEYEGAGLTATRRFNTYEGYPETRFFGRVTNADGKTATSSFTITRKKVLKENGKPVWAYVMFKECLKAFIAVNERAPETGDELEEFLCTASLKHRIVHNQKGTGVNTMGIKAVRS